MNNYYGVPADKVEISETNHENIPLSIGGYVLQIPVFKAGNYNFVIDNRSNTPLLNVDIDPFAYYLLVHSENGSLPYYDRFTDNEDGTYSLHLAVTNTMVSDGPYTFLLVPTPSSLLTMKIMSMVPLYNRPVLMQLSAMTFRYSLTLRTGMKSEIQVITPSRFSRKMLMRLISG